MSPPWNFNKIMTEEDHTKDHPPICDYEGSDYQSVFWDTGERAYEDAAEAVALKRLLPESGQLMLELGAGAGRNTPRFKNFDRVVLLDFSMTQLQQAQSRLGSSDDYIYVAGDVYKLPFVDGLFDTATMIRVIHHLKEAPQALNQIHRVLRSNGVFILEFANKLNLKAIIRYLLKRQEWSPFSREPVEFVPLNFDFHPKTIREWIAATGFRLERQLTVSHFRVRILKQLVPLKILVFLDSLAQLTGNLWQLTPSVFARMSKSGDKPTEPVEGFFQCPECQQNTFTVTTDQLTCDNCGTKWGIRDGIYDFRQPA